MQNLSARYPSAQFVGLEVREEPVKKMKDLGYDCYLATEELFTLPQKFDFIYGMSCIHHMTEPYEYLNNLYNHLNPEGILMFHGEFHRYDILGVVTTTILNHWKYEINALKITKGRMQEFCSTLTDNYNISFDGHDPFFGFPIFNNIYRKLYLHRVPYFNALTIFIQKPKSVQ